MFTAYLKYKSKDKATRSELCKNKKHIKDGAY